MAKKNESQEPVSRTIQLPCRFTPAEADRIKNAIWWVGRGLSVQTLFFDGIMKEVERIEKEHNGGKPFPPREGEIPKGRR